jgi:sugar lactone lactonase YvrE
MIFTYNNPELKVITGITCDSENNIYVAGFSSHNIHQISPDGELIEIYSMGISKPRAIFLQKNGRLLLVSNNEGKEVNIFQFQMNSDDQADIKEDEFER